MPYVTIDPSITAAAKRLGLKPATVLAGAQAVAKARRGDLNVTDTDITITECCVAAIQAAILAQPVGWQTKEDRHGQA